MTLTEIEQLADLIDEKLTESGGETTEEIEDLFKQFDFAQRDKIDGYIRLIRHLEGRSKLAQQTADEYRARAHSADRQVDWLKQRLAWHMDRMGTRELQGALHRAKWVANGGQAPLVGPGIENPLLLPTPFQKITVEADKQKLRDFLGKDGTGMGRIEGELLVRLGPRGQSLRIY